MVKPKLYALIPAPWLMASHHPPRLVEEKSKSWALRRVTESGVQLQFSGRWTSLVVRGCANVTQVRVTQITE